MAPGRSKEHRELATAHSAMSAVFKVERVFLQLSSCLFLTCRIWLIGLGAYSVFQRPQLLPEDLRYLGSNAGLLLNVAGLPGASFFLAALLTGVEFLLSLTLPHLLVPGALRVRSPAKELPHRATAATRKTP